MKLIVLNGPAGSGKDVAQNLLPGFKEKFSRPLKAGVQAMFCPDTPIKQLEKEKEERSSMLLGESYRQCQIELYRHLALHFGPDVLSRLMINRIEQKRTEIERDFGSLVTVSDGGVRAEYYPLLHKYGKDNILVVQLYRENTYFNDYRRYVDLSDVGVTTVKVMNNGSIGELELELRRVIEANKPEFVKGWLL